MTNGFVTLLKQLWQDEDYLALSDEARVLFLWTWTNEWANTAGLYRITVDEMAAALRRGPSVVNRALGELSGKPLVLYAHTSEMLWVVNRARHVAGTSERAQRAVVAAYERQPDCKLKRLWRDRYPSLAALSNGSVRPVS